jgi:hypothetical protein
VEIEADGEALFMAEDPDLGERVRSAGRRVRGDPGWIDLSPDGEPR